MDLLDRYNEDVTSLYAYFGCDAGYYAVSDHRDEYWACNGRTVWWGDNEEELETYKEELYRDTTDYIGEDYTALVLDMSIYGCDPDFAIFDNSKRCDFPEEE